MTEIVIFLKKGIKFLLCKLLHCLLLRLETSLVLQQKRNEQLCDK